jgi:DNA modification methylase
MIYQGDCLDILPTIEANSIDSIVTDPPYGLSFMGKDWDYGVPGVEIWRECLRVLKPGGYLLSFAGTRTQHRMAVNIEDAGFEIRDMIFWTYASGFPKSLNIGKAVDKIQGNEREVVGTQMLGGNAAQTTKEKGGTYASNTNSVGVKPIEVTLTKGTSEWEGWGTALKPALEPITVARKPLEKGLTVAENCLKWGVGGINIDGCRVSVDPTIDDMLRTVQRGKRESETWEKGSGFKNENNHLTGVPEKGRFPANLIHDGSQEVLELFPNSKSTNSIRHNNKTIGGNGKYQGGVGMDTFGHADSGSAARFFYCAKASKQDRDEGCGELPLSDCGMMEDDNYPIKTGSGNLRETKRHNNHPTVKPTNLMRYLCKLVTPPGGTILDPFMGSGSTGKAAALEGFRFIGIELESDYTEIAGRRIKAVQPLFAGV